jgi:putative peptidoglycan lipid II flippase
MVKRIVRMVNGEIRGLHEAAYLLGGFALLSQLLALVRDRLLAASFGAGHTLDLYYAAFRIPDIIFVSIASLVSVYILIPFLAQKAQVGREAEKNFINSVFSVFTGGILAVSLVVFFFAPLLLRLFFPGLAESELFPELVLLTRIMLLQPIFLGLSNLFGSITQTHRRFLLYAISPLLYNLGIIMGVLVLYPIFGLMGLGLGVVAGAILHLLAQVPFIVRSGFAPRIVLDPDWNDIKRVMALSLPRALALSAHQFALLVLMGVASVFTVGSIAVFNLAYNLQSVPLSIIGVSYSVAAFPTLAQLFTSGKRSDFFSQIVEAVRHILFWSLPAIVLFVVLRAQIVRVILGAGVFDWTETRLVAAALALFVISLAAQGLVLLFVRGYYAMGDTKTPLVVNVLTALCVVLFALLLASLFERMPAFQSIVETLLRVEGIPGTEILMLPLGYTLALLLCAIAFWTLFQRDFSRFWSAVSQSVWQSAVSALVMGIAAHQLLDVFDDAFDINTFWGIFLQGLLAGLGGIIVGIILLLLMKNHELSEISRALRRKFWKTERVTLGGEDVTG